ncbi:protein CONSERVED ONLY IN THE GREEN LINEAGE 160, chloroplastic isoform X1 [Dioscorea cayenensis subsp. rotundata]|uniref:Protein CONSERVED ONLY IN THE GREEN LINEAGE 160, chloroplastic isoform X1 n=1 Tax=Dioscorea cayennensis subsp. rotundata TaxID=55577 RepID=A0AB40AY78_DIOCR|nr:protein CONSERVED ONLY IN THE GREEN LINEAGE 160, chloroplastic isoform X1 [Dioscorea cayenensis subsp. rotundata]
MAGLHAGAWCITVRAASAPSVDESQPGPRQTKVVLPKKKPLKWSSGTAPGEYGGPPTTTKLRRYWGGSENEDPVTATGDFIWNKDFRPRMERLLVGKEAPDPIPFKKEQREGFLSLNRAMSLQSLEIDLSKELAPPLKPVLEQQVEAARCGRSATEGLNGAASPRWRLAPTRREQAKWDRATKAATGGSDVILRESRKERGDPKVLAAQSREQYLSLKQRLEILTVGIGGVGLVSAYVSYSPEIAASFGTGLLGSLVYIRMLGNTVDSMADGAKGLVKGAIGQPRLLVPVALVMMYNRWNEILVPNLGFVHLELIPILVGFFTYKIATFVQAIQESLTVEGKTEA